MKNIALFCIFISLGACRTTASGTRAVMTRSMAASPVKPMHTPAQKATRVYRWTTLTSPDPAAAKQNLLASFATAQQENPLLRIQDFEHGTTAFVAGKGAYVAADPFSSMKFGPHLMTFLIKENAPIAYISDSRNPGPETLAAIKSDVPIIAYPWAVPTYFRDPDHPDERLRFAAVIRDASVVDLESVQVFSKMPGDVSDFDGVISNDRQKANREVIPFYPQPADMLEALTNLSRGYFYPFGFFNQNIMDFGWFKGSPSDLQALYFLMSEYQPALVRALNFPPTAENDSAFSQLAADFQSVVNPFNATSNTPAEQAVALAKSTGILPPTYVATTKKQLVCDYMAGLRENKPELMAALYSQFSMFTATLDLAQAEGMTRWEIGVPDRSAAKGADSSVDSPDRTDAFDGDQSGTSDRLPEPAKDGAKR